MKYSNRICRKTWGSSSSIC